MSTRVTAEARRPCTDAEKWGCRLAGYTAGPRPARPAAVTAGFASFGGGRRSVVVALPPDGSREDQLALAARLASAGIPMVTVPDPALAAALADRLPLAVCGLVDAASSLPAWIGTARMIAIGPEHMHDYGLLRAVGATPLPVILYRGRAATIQEWLLAAEYVLKERPGRRDVILCEGGIRTFEGYTRHTFDVGAVAALRRLSPLPVIADPGAAAGRPELVGPLARAALAAGADGVVLHARPARGQAPAGAPPSSADGPQPSAGAPWALAPDDVARLAGELLGPGSPGARPSRRAVAAAER